MSLSELNLISTTFPVFFWAEWISVFLWINPKIYAQFSTAILGKLLVGGHTIKRRGGQTNAARP